MIDKDEEENNKYNAEFKWRQKKFPWITLWIFLFGRGIVESRWRNKFYQNDNDRNFKEKVFLLFEEVRENKLFTSDPGEEGSENRSRFEDFFKGEMIFIQKNFKAQKWSTAQKNLK